MEPTPSRTEVTPPSPRFDALDPARDSRSIRFGGWREAVTAGSIQEVQPALERVERGVAAGLHAVGFIAYGAAPAFEPALAVRQDYSGIPLLRFDLYAERWEAPPLDGLVRSAGEYALGPLVEGLSEEAYTRKVRRIIELIAAGDTYQVNLTFPLTGRLEGDPTALYRDLCRAQRSAYCALLDYGEHLLISASPELFFHLRGREVELRPMKGTRPRGRWSQEDEELAAELERSPKERAENLMIVDLLRNDLGRVADFGSVRVPELFRVERYPTVHQLTSSITGTLRADAGLPELIGALFPSGSVTGAPKIRTSEIIHELEEWARGPYTGAIGFISAKEAVFSVAIRTMVLHRRSGRFEVGVGSGITADSDASSEYRECIGKGAFLLRDSPDFELLESLRLERPGGYPLLPRHLERLAASARYFAFPVDLGRVTRALEECASGAPEGIHKVRLRVDAEGAVRVERDPIPETLPPARLRISTEAVDPADPFLYHKTTNRRVYERAAQALDSADDVILLNPAGEVTETTRANLVLELDGQLLTPALECGLLPGVMREDLLAHGHVRIARLTIADLLRAEKIYLVNAVRGWREGILLEGDRRSAERSATGGAMPE